MSKFTRKIVSVGIAVTTVVYLSGAASIIPIAGAQSLADLQAQIAALLAQIQTLQAQLSGAGGGVSSCSFSRDLTVGSKGDDVTCLQQTLISKGYLKIAAPTGYFGSLTQAAVAAWQKDSSISPTAGYFGPKSRAAFVAMGGTGTGTGTGGGVVVPSSGLQISLASDNPGSAALPKGATAVNFLKFNVAGNGTLDSLVFKRQGIGATADFASGGFYLYEGSRRLTTGRTINSTSHEVSFYNLGLAISGVRTFWLAADVSTTATPSNVNSFTLTSAGGNPTPSGIAAGSAMSITGQALGTITATSGATPTNPKVGQQLAKIAEFKLSAGATEDVMVSRVALTQGGSISRSNLTNFILKVSGNTVATVTSIGDRDLISFDFGSSYLLEKGQERTFEVWADITGSARSADTIVLYFDSKADVYAIGRTYGYPVTPDISALDATSDGDTLTVQGGDVTITFNGPVASDLALRAQDATLFDFTIASQNNIEIRNLRLHATTTNLTSGEGFNDFKVWDTTSNSVITSATDIASTTGQDVTFTDVINLSAGQSRRFKVTADVDSDDDDSDTILVSLNAFQSNDIRNLDNNTFVATSVIVPNSTVSGNTMTVKLPSLDVQLSANPTSQTYVKGTSNVALGGFSFRAVASNIRLDSVRVTATASSGTLGSGEVQNLALYDGATRVSDIKSLDSSSLNATFSNLNMTISKGDTKVLTLKGNVATDAGTNDIYYFYLATAGADDITAYDPDGNAATLTGTAANSGGTVAFTVAGSGDVTVVKAPDDTESEAGIIVAGREQTLGKFRFTAANEDMTINKMQLLLVPTSSATATSGASADESPTVKLYDGSTQVGNSSGYSVQASGDNSGVVAIENLGWVVSKDSSKVLTVKGSLNTVAGGADSGSSVYASVMSSNFEAQGASAKDTTITAATGNQKVVYKTKPTITVGTGDSTLTNGLRKVMTFTVAADSAEQVAWKKIQAKVTMTGATMSAVGSAPGTTGNVQIKDVSSGSNLNIATAFSSLSTTTAQQVTITGGNTGYVALILSSEQAIAAGSSKQYELYLTFADVPTASGSSASAVVNLHREESTVVAATLVDTVEGASNGTPSFVWSDYSTVGHSELTSTDWANGVFVKTLPSTSFTLSL